MRFLLILRFRVFRIHSQNSNPKFIGKYRKNHYTFLFDAYFLYQRNFPYSISVSVAPLCVRRHCRAWVNKCIYKNMLT